MTFPCHGTTYHHHTVTTLGFQVENEPPSWLSPGFKACFCLQGLPFLIYKIGDNSSSKGCVSEIQLVGVMRAFER